MQYTAEDPERDIVEPAVKGTINVLRCARLAGGVRRVVLTSSTASILTFKPPSDTAWQWSEDDWNIDTTLEDQPYRYSKTLAEQAGISPPPFSLSTHLTGWFLLHPPHRAHVKIDNVFMMGQDKKKKHSMAVDGIMLQQPQLRNCGWV
jgi:hypothetical protein